MDMGREKNSKASDTVLTTNEIMMCELGQHVVTASVCPRLTLRNREKEEVKCVSPLNSSPASWQLVNPQRFSLFAWHKSSHGHPLARTGKER